MVEKNKYKEAWEELGEKIRELADRKSEEFVIAGEYEFTVIESQIEREIFMLNQIHHAYANLNNGIVLKNKNGR